MVVVVVDISVPTGPGGGAKRMGEENAPNTPAPPENSGPLKRVWSGQSSAFSLQGKVEYRLQRGVGKCQTKRGPKTLFFFGEVSVARFSSPPQNSTMASSEKK